MPRAAGSVARRALSDRRGADHRRASAAGTLRDPYRRPGLAWRRLRRRGPGLSAAQQPQDEHGEDDGEHHRQPAAAAAVAGDYGRDARRVLGQDLLHRLVGGRQCAAADMFDRIARSEEHTSELQSLMRISYAVFCLKKKKNKNKNNKNT